MWRIFTNIELWANRCFLAGAALGAFSLLVMIGLITVDVIGRKLGHSTGVAFEITGYLLLIAVFLGTAYTLKSGKHIEITLITGRLKERVRRWLRVATSAFSVAFVGWLFWYTLQNAIFFFTNKSTSTTTLHTPLWIFQLLIPIGLALLALAIIIHTIGLFKPIQD